MYVYSKISLKTPARVELSIQKMAKSVFSCLGAPISSFPATLQAVSTSLRA